MCSVYSVAMRIYPYLRASTDEQDVNRAVDAIEAFLADHNAKASTWFNETESGATLARPKLFQLLEIMEPGDVLLVEQVDRLSRLNANDWASLKSTIMAKGLRIVSLDLPTSHQLVSQPTDDFTSRILEAVNAMLLDMLAATSRKDYDDRRRRQQEGIKQAKAEGKYRGRQPNKDLHNSIEALLTAGHSYRDINRTLKCSYSTIAKVKAQLEAKEET